MYSIFPWMFPLCNYNHKLVMIFAYIWSYCQGVHGYELISGWETDLKDFCGISEDEARHCLDILVSLGLLEIDKMNICHPLIGDDE